MSEVPDGKCKLVLTSPSHPSSGELSDTSAYQKYLSDFERTLVQSHRKLVSDGYLVVVVTDNYHGGKLVIRHQMFCDLILKVGFNIFDMKIWSRGDFVELYRPSFSYIIFSSKSKTKKLEDIKKMHEKPFGYGVWKLESDYSAWKKYSAFNPELARRVILALSEEGDTVIDPYMGTGTSVIIADKLGRHGFGYEINTGLKSVFDERKKEIDPGSLESFVQN